MLNYAFITRDFHILPIADRLQDDGKNVVLGMVQDEENPKTPEGKSEARLALYDGIVNKYDADDVIEWLEKKIPHSERAGWFVMFDYGDLYEYSERALKAGYTKGIFPTEEGYELEKDRQKGKDFAKKHYPGLKVAEVHEFKKIDDAIKFLEQDKETIYVLKSEGSNAETVCPQSEDVDLAHRQIIGALRTEQKDYEKGFTLEARILRPVELSPVMLFWNGKPLFSVVELENKPLGSGNIGRLTGGCQNLTIRTPLNCELNRIAFPPIVYEMAKKTPGIGLFDAGLLYDGKEFYFTEFCSQRWGFDGIFAEIAMCGDEHGHNNAAHHFDMIAKGESPLLHNYGAAVRLFQTEPDGKHPDMYQGGYQIDWLDEVSDQLFLYCIERKDVEGSDDKVFVSNGYEKDVGVATGTGETAIDAVNRAYRCATSIAMTGLVYRPHFDFVSKDYFTSIWNRLDFLKESNLLLPA